MLLGTYFLMMLEEKGMGGERTVKMTSSPSVCDDYHVVRETTPGTAVVWRIQLTLTVTQATDTGGMAPPRCCD